MKIVAALVLLLAATLAGRAQILPTAATSARSMSGQFLVLAAPPSRFRPELPVGTNADWIRLEPTLLAISAERIKEAVWRELDFNGSWRQQVTLVLQVARSTNDLVTIISEPSPRGWSYRVVMPDELTPERYMRAMVQVVLLELANRTAVQHSAEIPAWLAEGIAYGLLANHRAELVLTPPRLEANGVFYRPVVADVRRISPLELAHRTLLDATPLTFEELSWPAPGQVETPLYRASAQVFTYELLHLRGGQACLGDFLTALPGYLNWQLAFLQAFKPHFSRPLDIEKWWSLRAAEFSGRDLIQTWPYKAS